MVLAPKCRRCGRVMLRTTLPRVVRVLPQHPELVRRDPKTPAFFCPADLVIAVVRQRAA
jgi:hypothetical protein